jgi:hypothetical protein
MKDTSLLQFHLAHDWIAAEPRPIWSLPAGMFGMSGFPATIAGQTTRMAPRRVTAMQGVTVVCDEMATVAFYRFKIDLAPRDVAVEAAPHAAAVVMMRQVKPPK